MSNHGNAFSSPGFGSSDEFADAEVDGKRQLDKAVELFAAPGEPICGPLDVRARWVIFGDYTVRPEFAVDGKQAKLCTPARGWSFACGAKTGRRTLPASSRA